jgi:hypothetical protein
MSEILEAPYSPAQDVFRTVIIPLAQVGIASQIAAVFSTGNAPLQPGFVSSTGQNPPQSIISTGYISAQFATLIPLQDHDGQPISAGEPDTLAALVLQAGLTITAADIAALFEKADVTEQPPRLALARLGLQLVQHTE